MTDFGSANAERQRTERAMSRCVTITTNNRLAGLSGAQFRTDHVHDAALCRLKLSSSMPNSVQFFSSCLICWAADFTLMGTRPAISPGSVGVE